ncbi:hypothetical protein N566_04740 [Streptomycetaceae bacterium MP113-05]|nr:hypothetical protein N566_04740 [Streptomycetaceae bacterium MP113-05]
MLADLGLGVATDAVYRAMLRFPREGVAALAVRTGLTATEVREALGELSALALVRESGAGEPGLRAISPRLATEILLSRRQVEVVERQRQLENARLAAARLMAEFTHHELPDSGQIQYLHGLDAVRDYLETINSQVQEEFLTLAPGGPQSPENMRASRALNIRLLERGVSMRTVYLESIRRDHATVEHAQWLVSLGADVRTAPFLPNRVIVCDRRIALVATDSEETSLGALAISNPGLLSLVISLFHRIWKDAAPLGSRPRPGYGPFTVQQLETLRLMNEGRTDESIAKSLGVTSRTVRRTVTTLLSRLGAQSRFQAGALAYRAGLIPD